MTLIHRKTHIQKCKKGKSKFNKVVLNKTNKQTNKKRNKQTHKQTQK